RHFPALPGRPRSRAGRAVAVSVVAGHSANQRRVLAELGLVALRLRRPASDVGAVTPVDDCDHITLVGAATNDVLLAAVLALMPAARVSRQPTGPCLDLPSADDGLVPQLTLDELRRRPDWKRRLWERQRRLRRQVGG